MNPDKTSKLSAIIACYLDAKAIPVMYKRLVAVFAKIGVDYEIIFVNDCSPDDTRDVLTEITNRDKAVIAIHHTRNFGSQNAFTSGMHIFSGDAVILLDGDLQDPPEMIEHFYHKWREGYDVVYGERVKREMSAGLDFVYKGFYRLFNFMSYLKIPLDAGDFSLIDRRVAEIINKLPENDRFLRGLRAWVGYKQTGVPYHRPERMFGHSTNNLVKNLLWARKAILSFSYQPIDFILLLALGFVGFAIVGIIFQVLSYLFFPEFSPRGYTSLITIILLMSGVQLFCLGIIGSYLAHIYEEVKRRPPYLVERYDNYPGSQLPLKTRPDERT